MQKLFSMGIMDNVDTQKLLVAVEIGFTLFQTLRYTSAMQLHLL